MKMLGILLICVSFSLFGYNILLYYKSRITSIDMFINFVLNAKEQIIYKQLAVMQIIENQIIKSNNDFFIKLKNEINNGNSIDISYEKAIKDCKGITLNTDDISIIGDFLKSIGKTSISMQNDNCNRCLNQLEKQKEEAKEQYNINGKLFFKLFVAVGIFISILLV